MIMFGPWHPDSAGINTKVVLEARNVAPGEIGFRPLPSTEPVTAALPSEVRGAVSILVDDGTVQTFAGVGDRLFKLSSTNIWENVSNTEIVYDDAASAIVDDAAATITIDGNDYGCGSGEQWKFATYGTLLIATNVVDGPKKFDLETATNFSALGGSPPAARYIDIVREFVFLGAIFGEEKRVQWSALGNAEGWTAGTNSSDYQDFPNGGPIRGLIGGETAYIFQANKVTRGTFVPGSAEIFQFDEVEGAAGLTAPHSLVRLRADAYYLAADGLRRFDLRSASSQLIGVKKWVKWFLADKKSGTDLTVLGAANPVKPIVVWAYVSSSNIGSTPDRLLIYDWSLDEATFADLSVETLLQWLSPGLTLDTIDGYGSMETLPFSLDSAFWRGGAQLMGLFSTDHKLSLQAGANMAASIITADGTAGGRMMIKGLRPQVDSASATLALAMRERDGDTVTFGAAEAMEDTGVCPQHQSGRIARAKLVVPSGATWTAAKGIETLATRQGQR